MSKKKSTFGQSDIVRLSDEDASVELLERAVTGLWDVVNELTRFRRTTRQNYRVTIFGSARLKRATPVYNGVKKLAGELTKMGCDIISGGGPGLMQAANEGAHSVRPKALKRSVGIRIALPFEKFDLENLDKERRKAVAKSMRTMSVEELKALGNEIFRYADDPWREKFFDFIAENPGATFHHAVMSDGVNIVYCRDQDKGMWFLPGSGMGPLQATGRKMMSEIIQGKR